MLFKLPFGLCFLHSRLRQLQISADDVFERFDVDGVAGELVLVERLLSRFRVSELDVELDELFHDLFVYLKFEALILLPLDK